MDRIVDVHCACAEVPDDLMHGTVAELGAKATMISDGFPAGPRFYRCVVCATIWQDQWFPAMHVDVEILSRTCLDSAGTPVPVFYDLPASGLRRR